MDRREGHAWRDKRDTKFEIPETSNFGPRTFIRPTRLAFPPSHACLAKKLVHRPYPPISGWGMSDCGLPYWPPGVAHGNPRSPQSKGLRMLFSTAVP